MMILVIAVCLVISYKDSSYSPGCVVTSYDDSSYSPGCLVTSYESISYSCVFSHFL